MVRARCFVASALLWVAVLVPAAAQSASAIREGDLREWLSYIASDELEGRSAYSRGLDLAAAYIENHLRDWRLTPAGDAGSFRQTVVVQEVRAINRSTVTVRVGRETRVFRQNEGVVFPPQSGASRTFTVDRVEFAGYGLDAPASRHVDFRGKDVRGALVVWLGSQGPSGVDPQRTQKALEGRSRHIIEDLRAAAALTEGVAHGRSSSEVLDASVAPDFVTAERLDKPVAPSLVADPALLEFLFRDAPTRYGELKRRADTRQPLPAFRLKDVSVTFDVDVQYQVQRTRQTENLVAIVEGSDAVFKHTFVAFGAHHDHVGQAPQPSEDGALQPPLYGRVNATAANDRVWNGADDDGSGTVALMALARAFADGPRPKRSLLFVWHAGEEIGTHGSRYFADHPTVPIDSIVAQLNIDMVGRNRDDKPSEANTLYMVGADRISTELDDVTRRTNRALAEPLNLSDEMNDPSDPEQLYYRSDHYSYAALGIPVIFFTTGLHPDYHTNTDEVSRILFDKLTRVTELLYATGMQLANLDHPPVRDNRGPRAAR